MPEPGKSLTPILDLKLPLPSQADRQITGKFATPFQMFLGMIVITKNYSFLLVPLGFLLIAFLTAFVHEMGHVFAGLFVGMKFDGVTIGPFVLSRSLSGWKFRIRPRIYGGHANMSCRVVRLIRKREMAMVLGGPIASLIFGLLSVVGGEIARAQFDSPWPTFFEFCGIFSLYIGILSFSSYRSGPYAGDGILLRALLGKIPGARQIIASQALCAVANKNKQGIYWQPRWSQLAYGELTSISSSYGHSWFLYSTSEDVPTAAQNLEECLVNSGHLEPHDRDILICEVVTFIASRQGDAEKAKIWQSRLKRPAKLPPLSRLRMETAMAQVTGNAELAIEHCSNGLKILQQADLRGSARIYQDQWMNWRSEIIRLQSTQV